MRGLVIHKLFAGLMKCGVLEADFWGSRRSARNISFHGLRSASRTPIMIARQINFMQATRATTGSAMCISHDCGAGTRLHLEQPSSRLDELFATLLVDDDIFCLQNTTQGVHRRMQPSMASCSVSNELEVSKGRSEWVPPQFPTSRDTWKDTPNLSKVFVYITLCFIPPTNACTLCFCYCYPPLRTN
jgi:hypothetical protein